MSISVITCTIRDEYINDVFENYCRQNWKDKELLIILNKDTMDVDKWKQKVGNNPNILVIQLPEDTSLGACLNEGVRLAKNQYIAKFDDDDYYSPYYLSESMLAFNQKGADIVGKRTVFTYFKESEQMGIHRPFNENKWVNDVRGATIMFNKNIHAKIPFPDINRGEDGSFLWRSNRAGYRIYSSSKNNFVCVRRGDLSGHSENNHSLIKGCGILFYTNDYQSRVTQEF